MQQFNNPNADFGTQHSPPLEGCPQDGVVNNQSSKNYYLINDIIIYHKPKLNLPCNINLKERAKALRYAENLPEVLFWMQITKKRFHKIDFDRQRIIGNYIVDFYIKKLGLVIEIDGDSHDDKEVYDKAREEYFFSLGLKVYRITVDDVMKNMEFALMGLEEYIINEYA
ncbi:endonuclease domain-containing protein [Pedobacter paludis]|uniref:DNA methylase n=1 Tax=Pedobacter paludis TaxID=2203212 RepID=A0A317F353_9SPHI|nr:endonuclease domain-containing protein [Pedobacter paludis]PWS32279.1 DNA methylase [Pedobacter paludis]